MKMNHTLRSAFLVLNICIIHLAYGQLPPNQPEQDCFSAISICTDTYFQPNAYTGAGDNPDEINGANSCLLLGERNSVWYVFTIQTQGQLCFTIAPTDTLDDYDWALFNLTNASCAAIYNDPSLEVACSWTYNNGCQGQTGANGNTANCPGQSTPCLTVNPGETYVLNISNFTASNAGYTLDFSQSSARLFDDIPPTLDEVSSFCTGVTATFSENINCATVNPEDFTFTGPDGPYTISRVISNNCDNGGAFDREFDLVISPPIQQAGNYTLTLIGTVNDNCGNVAPQSTHTVFMPLPPTASLNAPQPQCQSGNQFGFAYTGPSSVRNYYWDFGDSTGSTDPAPIHSFQSAGNKTVTLIITDVNGCSDTASQSVTVWPKPDVRFVSPYTVCQDDSVFFDNQTTFPGSPMVSMMWRFSNGNQTTDFSPTQTFDIGGRYQAFLEATNAMGCRDTASRFVTVYPKADIDFETEDNICNGNPVQFLNTTTIQSGPSNDVITDWNWEFGDGNTAGQLNDPTHLYDTAGVYRVVLTVTTDKGCADSLIKDQIIHQPPPPEITNDPACFGERTILQAIPVTGGVTSWYREPGDTIPFHQGAAYYTDPVTYAYEYYVEQLSPEGCISERVPLLVDYHRIATGEIMASDSSLEFPVPVVSFSVAGDVEGASYQWNFGDGTSSDMPAPAHEYKYPDKYQVVVRVTDIYGCEYEFEKTIEVKSVMGVFIPSAFSPNADGRNDELFIQHRLLEQFTFSVFNRFGEEVFQTNSPDFRWDGRTPTGYAIREGVYVYRMRARDVLGNFTEKTGTITVIR